MLNSALLKQQLSRESLYASFPYRKDAIFNLLDSLLCDGYRKKSVISLTESKHFSRSYSSLSDAVGDGLTSSKQKLDWKKLFCKNFQNNVDLSSLPYHRFVMDCTSNQRPYSNTLEDRSIQYTPNPAPGNKPIGVGHQYSLLAYVPEGSSKQRKNWIYPMDMQRVQSNEKGTDIGMEQLKSIVKELNIEKEKILSVGDTSYSQESCRKNASESLGLAHLFRIRSNRCLFVCLKDVKEKGKKGRPRLYGHKMKLGEKDIHLEANNTKEFSWKLKSGKTRKVEATRWENLTFRGSKSFSSQNHPISLIRYQVKDEEGFEVFKKPLWIGIMGSWKEELGLEESFHHYQDRFDIEHWFRFSKNNLHLNNYQSPDIEHEEAWWKLVTLAYLQLAYVKEEASSLPKPWERYLPEFQNPSSRLATPSQVQRDYVNLLAKIGSPAKHPCKRGNPKGRRMGEKQKKREFQPCKVKGKKKKTLSATLRKEDDLPDSEKIMTKFVTSLKKKITDAGFSIEEIFEVMNPQK